MPRRLMDNLECEVIDEEVHECTLGHDILSADLDGEDALLPNIRKQFFKSRSFFLAWARNQIQKLTQKNSICICIASRAY